MISQVLVEFLFFIADAQLKQQIEQQAREKEWEIQKETEMV